MDENQIPLEGADFLSYPSFYDELICVPNIYSDEHEALMLSKDWLTQSLKREINENSPTNDDVIINHVHSEYTYKKESFQRACQSIFVKHRQFVNWLQFQQFTLAFLEKWNVEGKPSGCLVKCALKNAIIQNQ